LDPWPLLWTVVLALTVLALVPATAVLSVPAEASLQDGSADVCWSPDAEFPVPCDEDED
jgi:hypothetical protein